MTEANELYERVARELKDVVMCDNVDSEEEQQSFSFPPETVSDDIPPSLLSYFETSKSRAMVCEKFMLEDLEDITGSHYTEDMMNLPCELCTDMMKLNEHVSGETENEETSSLTCAHLPIAHTETEALFIHSLSVSPINEGEAENVEHMGCETYEGGELKTLMSYMKEEQTIKKEQRRGDEEMEKEEKRRQRQRDFQEELKKIVEAEKLHQKELELMEKRAQEKLEEEFRLQQEMISDLQKRVKEETELWEKEQRRMKEEEETRKKKEEDRRKREEETIKEEKERKRKEEERRRQEEDEEKRKIEEMRLIEKQIGTETEKKKREDEKNMLQENMKKEEERKLEEMRLKEKQRKREEIKKAMDRDEKRRIEEETWKREEEKNRIEEDKKRNIEEEKRQWEEDEKRRIEKEKIKSQSNEEKNEALKDVRKKEGERNIKELRLKEEDKSGQTEEEESKRKESGKINRKDEPKKTRKMEDTVTTKKTEEDKGMKNAEEIGLRERQKKEKEDRKNSVEEDKDKEELSIIKTLETKTMQEEIRQKEEVRKSEEETKKVGVPMMVFEHMKGKNEETGEREEKQLEDDKESPKKEEEKTIKGEEQRRQKEEKVYSNTEEEIRLETEEEWNKANEVKNRKLEHETKTTAKDECQEEVERRQEEVVLTESEDGRRNVGEDKRQIRDKEENIKAEEKRLTKEQESNNIMVQDNVEKEESLRPQESLHLENSTTMTAVHTTESTSRSTMSDAVQPHDPNNAVSQASPYLPHDHHDAPDEPRSSSPASLPEHTEQRRLTWMTDCISWATLSLRNKNKQTGRVQRRWREVRRSAVSGTPPPLCPHTLLQSTGCQSLQQVSTVTLEKLPGCSLSILSQCTRLQSLTLRRCGLKALEGISQLRQLCHVDVQENDISFLDCENMAGLRVLRLGHNKLTSIHGLSGADNLDVLDLSHNSITRIAGLDSLRRLQRLSLDHNQLISTKGLKDVYTLLHLDCSHNHLACVEGLENNALLQTLNLRANCLYEPPSLNNHVLLRELHLDDNSISSLQGLALCWLPLMHHFSASRNRITLLPSMSDFVSLANLDLRFNCLSEVQNVCECVEGCQFLQEVYLNGNPLQGESGWRSMLQKAVTSLRAIDGEETDSCLSAPTLREGGMASGSFLTFCQAQLKQTRDLEQLHSRELSDAASHLNTIKSSCQHFTETLKLAVEQRFAHEYGDHHVSAGQTAPRKTLEVDSGGVETLPEHSQMESTERVPPCIQSRTSISCSDLASGERTSTLDAATSVLKTEKSAIHHLDMAAVSSHHDLDSQNSAAVVIQQWWRKYRQKCGNISGPPTAQRGGSESGPSYEGNVAGQDYAATVIQAFWRGFSLRRRLASALATVACPDGGEDETFEEVDVDGFVLDEAALEKYWTLPLPEDSSSRQQPPSLKPKRAIPEPFLYTPPSTPSWRPKQAWVAGEVDPPGHRTSSQSSTRSKYPASPSVLSGVSARSQRILEEWGFTNSNTALLMLKRAQKMKSKKHQQKKHMVCTVELGLQQQEEQTEKVMQERAQQWLHTQSHRGSESEHFLPEISSDILNGGRVQLVADPGHAEHLHHGSGLWASRGLAVQPSKERNYLRRDSLGHAREEVSSPKRVASAPTKKERISFRDNPVQLSGGWGGGKKRNKVRK